MTAPQTKEYTLLSSHVDGEGKQYAPGDTIELTQAEASGLFANKVTDPSASNKAKDDLAQRDARIEELEAELKEAQGATDEKLGDKVKELKETLKVKDENLADLRKQIEELTKQLEEATKPKQDL